MISDPDAQWAALRRQRGPRRRGLAGTLILSAALAVAALLALPAAGALEKRAMPTLFGPAALGDLPPAGGAPADAHPAYERTLYATVDAAMLGAAGPEKLALNLFADTTLTAVRTGVEVADDRTGKSTWLGRIEDDPLSTVVLSVSDRIVAGTIDTRNSSFVIGPTVGAKGVHTVAELDPGKLPPEGHPPLPNFKRAVQGDTNAQDTKVHEKSKRAQGEMWPGFIPVVDVLVAYTTAAKDYYGGTNNTLTSIDLGFDQTNAAFARSGVNVRVRLVRAIEINFSEGNMGEDLSRLQIKGDGILDELHTVRDQVGADLVSLWTTDYTYCGIGYLMYSPLVTMESWGFTVISVRCATQSHSFAHELGHNLGAHHDRASAGTEQGCYSYSYGYQNPSLGYRTIMSYPCSTGSCARVNYFSNPDLNKDGLDGYPLGVPVGDPLEANNVQTFNLNGPIVAQYRASVVPLTTATATSSTSKTPFTTRTKTSSTSRTSNTITKTATKTSSTRTTRTLLPNEARGCSTPTTLPILDGIAVSNTVNTHAGSALISSVRAEIELKHTYMSDLVINLTRISDGMQVRLYQHSGCIDYADRGAILIFDDAASAVPQSNCAASSFKPLQPLSAFVGPKATDSWRLDIYDEWGGDNGVFYNWCLYLQTNGGTSTSSTSSTSTLTMKPKTFGDVSTVTPLTVTATTTKTLVVTQPPVTVSVTLPAVTSSVTRTLTATQTETQLKWYTLYATSWLTTTTTSISVSIVNGGTATRTLTNTATITSTATTTATSTQTETQWSTTTETATVLQLQMDVQTLTQTRTILSTATVLRTTTSVSISLRRMVATATATITAGPTRYVTRTAYAFYTVTQFKTRTVAPLKMVAARQRTTMKRVRAFADG